MTRFGGLSSSALSTEPSESFSARRVTWGPAMPDMSPSSKRSKSLPKVGSTTNLGYSGNGMDEK